MLQCPATKQSKKKIKRVNTLKIFFFIFRMQQRVSFDVGFVRQAKGGGGLRGVANDAVGTSGGS